MNKIYGYECKRLIFNRFFIGIAALMLIYGWQVLKNVTIFGVAYTAPFSAWSFGDYLSRMAVFLWIGILFFVSFYHTGEERRREGIFAAAPMKPYVHELIRCGSILTVSLVLAIVSVLPAVIFYGAVFGLYPIGMIVLVGLVTLLPIVLFALGSGKVISRAGRPFLYAWMLVPFVLRALTLPEAFGLLNGSLFSDRPLALGILDPEFSLPAGCVIVQCSVLVAGLVLALAKFNSNGKK